ncbi:MAG TPA: amino acid ABC transporter substrate-binding protein [Devosiaceae bacterium]|jgi:general L-amino acid transport system substrate-binding protein
MRFLKTALCAAVTFTAMASAMTMGAQASTLDDVKAHGAVKCGVPGPTPGFAYTDNDGKAKGFNVDLCRAVAAAIFGDPSKFETTILGPTQNLTTLAAGGIDLLVSNVTWTVNRDNGAGNEFTQVTFYDGQGFVVPKASGVTSVKDLDGATICVAQGTTTELNVADYFTAHDMKYNLLTFADWDAVRVAYDQGRCDAWSLDRSGLAARVLSLTKPDDHIILPDTISKEPLGPVVRQGDDQWAHVVKWAIYAMISAEENGVTSQNVDDELKNTKNAEVKRLLGADGDIGPKLGLSKDWAYNIIKTVGNYGEIYDRNVGEQSPLHLVRGANRLWTDGGLMIAPAFR